MSVRTLARGEVFQKYGVELTRFATSLVGPSDAQDVVSDALVSSMWSESWDQVENQRAYLYRAVTSQARMKRRSDSRRHRREIRAANDAMLPDPSSLIDVWEALDHLSTDERAVVFLYYWEDLSEASVGQRLGASERTVRRRLKAARSKLGGLLK